MQRPRHFSHADAKRFYDRFGSRQDWQRFYEDAALDSLIQHADFSSARSVLELGCGTGRFAARLLSSCLAASARYVGLDISETMVHLASERLAPWADRAEVHLSSGDFDFSGYGNTFDRFVSTYVFDLLSNEDIDQALNAAHAVMQPGGLLCVVGLAHGTDAISRATSRIWRLVYNVRPSLVGGCRPLDLAARIPESHWRELHREVVVKLAVPSEVLVAEAIA